jgi:FkbM family methyltransferase
MGLFKYTVKKIFKIAGYDVTVRSSKKKQPTYDALDFFSKSLNEGEIFLQNAYSILVKEGDCVIDVGANHGFHTTALSRLVGETGQVIACEAVPASVNIIKDKLTFDNVKLYCAAITNPRMAAENKEITFNYFPYRDTVSGIKKRPDVNEKSELITVPTATLDEIIAKENPNQPISFIKVDCEGGDFDVLLGAENILITHKPVVIFEDGRAFSANLYNYTQEDFFGYFERLGYQLFSFVGTGEIKNWENKDYWETWLVHKDSEFNTFFHKHYANFVKMFVMQRNETA